MTKLAVETMAQRLTVPFARGASTLELTLVVGGNATQSQIASYDFSEYQALFDQSPSPHYVLRALQDIVVATQVTVDYVGSSPATTGSTSVTVLAGTLAGTSLALDLNGHTEAEIRLQRVHMSPAAPDGETANWWSLRALLGDLAKLLWVLGWEKDHIRRHLALVQAQRHLPEAADYSLDLLGYDLGVPRFSPQPYSFDADTIALYHLDDQPTSGQPEVDQVEDSMKRYPGKTDHSATNTGRLARSGTAGRFGRAFSFNDPGAENLIPAQTDFDLQASDSFTVECFVKPDVNTIDGDVLAKSANPADATKAGWALSVGTFGRGLPLNVRFLVNSGAQLISLFADKSLTTDRFYHLAGVIDRGTAEVRLYLDGQLQAAQSITGLGAVINTEPVRMGRTPGAAYRGVIDEVRLTSQARRSFHPVLGEDDEAYRRRLELFERWTLPTLSNLLNILNQAVDNIGGDTSPLILNDTNAALVGGTLELTVQPIALAAGECIDAQGNRRIREADVNGTAADETTFDPIYLLTHNDARVVYGPPPARTPKPNEAPPDTHKLQLVMEQRLNRLLDLLGAGGQLQIISAFDPRTDDLRAVGRGLLFTHSAIGPEQLAAQAHRAGFSFVCNRSDVGAVYASTEQGDYIQLVITGGSATSANGFTMKVNETLNLEARPPLPPGTLYNWETIACGAGQADFTTPADRSTVTLTATAPGTLNVKVEVIRRQNIASESIATGTMVFRIGPLDLADGASIGDDGTQGVSEAVAGEPDDFFHPTYLVTHADARATYGNDVNNRRMQPSVAQRLNQLLALLAANAIAGPLTVVKAYDPNASGLPGQGRAITLSHPTLSAGTLGVLAHAAGFSYVLRQGNQILARQSPGELVTVAGPQEVFEGAAASLTVLPRAAPLGVAVGANAIYTANRDTDTLSEIDPVTGQVKRAIKVGWGPGVVALSPDGKGLYTADSQGNTVTAVDVATGNIAGFLAVRRNPVALAHHPTKQRLYVLCKDDNSLQEIDTAALSVLNTLSLPLNSLPTGMAVTPDGAAIWVALNGVNQISVVGTSPVAVVGSVPLAQAPLKIAISPDGKKAYATQPTNGSIVIIDVAGRTAAPPVSVGPAGSTSTPHSVAVALDNTALYVTDATVNNERVHLLKPDGSEIVSVRVRQGPQDVAVSADHAYVVNHGSDEVSVIDPVEKGVINTWRLGSGLGEALTWVLRLGAVTRVRLSSTTAPQVLLSGDRAGPALLRAVYVLRDNTEPYTFEIRLKPALEELTGPQFVTIRKEQYDLIMNILNAFHPIGVEVMTLPIRERVIEVRDQLLSAFPDYTYPNFRVRGPLPRQARKE